MNRAGAPVILKAEFVGEQMAFEAGTICGERGAREEIEEFGVACFVFRFWEGYGLEDVACFAWEPGKLDEVGTFENLELFVCDNSRGRVGLGKVVWEGEVGEGDFNGACCVLRGFVLRVACSVF